MATDFDFDGTFNDDDENNPPDTAQAEQQAEAGEEEQPLRSRRNLIRIILLVLLIVVLLCACVFALPRFGINIPGLGGSPPPSEPAATESTEEVAPTDEAEIPPAETTEPGLEEEAPVGTEEAAEGEQPAPEEQPLPETTGEPVEGEQPAPEEQPLPETTEEPVEGEPPAEGEPQPEGPTPELIEEPTGEPTMEPVPGPTATSGAPEMTTPESCDNNTPPTADANGPYEAMMGKGQAFVPFDASGSSDAEGNITEYTWNFGDGSAPQSSQSAATTHGYTAQGVYEAILIVTDACGETNQAMAEVRIVGPTPPSEEDASDEESSSEEDNPGDAEEAAASVPAASPPTEASTTTLGFCYWVQRGDTLSGVAAYYGLSTVDLARVNNIGPNYFVIAGESLFVPGEPVKDGPNGYQVEAGDTFYSIAYQCDIPASYLAEVNNSNADAALTPGEIVILPLSR